MADQKRSAHRQRLQNATIVRCRRSRSQQFRGKTNSYVHSFIHSFHPPIKFLETSFSFDRKRCNRSETQSRTEEWMSSARDRHRNNALAFRSRRRTVQLHRWTTRVITRSAGHADATGRRRTNAAEATERSDAFHMQTQASVGRQQIDRTEFITARITVLS